MANRVPHYEIDTEEPATLAECYREPVRLADRARAGHRFLADSNGNGRSRGHSLWLDGPPDSGAAQVH